MSDIFISYSRHDRARVEQLVRCLESRGWEVWWDPEIRIGTSFRSAIQEVLSAARCVVVAWSRTSVGSDWVLAEASVGKDRGILVPVSIDGTQPQLDFAQLQTADLSGWTGDPSAPEFARLVQGIEHVLGAQAPVENPAQPPMPAGSDRPRIRWPRHVGAAAAGLIALGAAVWFTPLRDLVLPEPKPWPKSITHGGREMMLIPAGTFQMGADAEAGDTDHPKRKAFLGAFYLDRFEVTSTEFAAAGVSDAPGQAPGCPDKPDHPACAVSWTSAAAFCRASGKRLPTEAEWEKAARGTDGRVYPWGNGPVTGDNANYCDQSCPSDLNRDPAHNDGYAEAAPVSAYADGRSPYGIFNMAGNVSEWTADWYDRDYYQRGPERNPENTARGTVHGRVVRGGDWNSTPDWLTSFARTWSPPDAPGRYVGFRCALSAEDLPQR